MKEPYLVKHFNTRFSFPVTNTTLSINSQFLHSIMLEMLPFENSDGTNFLFPKLFFKFGDKYDLKQVVIPGVICQFGFVMLMLILVSKAKYSSNAANDW